MNRLTDNFNPPGAARTAKDSPMAKNIDDVQRIGNDQVDIALKSFDVLSKGVHAIAGEVADYSKQAFEQGSKAVEKLLVANSFDKAFAVQTEYARGAYDDFVARTAKLGQLYAAVANESYRPFEAYWAKVAR
jgi:hypothetical protein